MCILTPASYLFGKKKPLDDISFFVSLSLKSNQKGSIGEIVTVSVHKTVPDTMS